MDRRGVLVGLGSLYPVFLFKLPDFFACTANVGWYLNLGLFSHYPLMLGVLGNYCFAKLVSILLNEVRNYVSYILGTVLGSSLVFSPRDAPD